MKIMPIQLIKFLRGTEKMVAKANKQKDPLKGANAARSFLMTTRHLLVKFDKKEEMSLIPGVNATIVEASFQTSYLDDIIKANPVPPNAAIKLVKPDTIHSLDTAIKALESNSMNLPPKTLFLRRLYLAFIIYVRLVVFIQLNYKTLTMTRKTLVKALLNEYLEMTDKLNTLATSTMETYPSDITGTRLFQVLAIYNKSLRNAR